MQVWLASSTSSPTSVGLGLHVYIFIYSGEVCGRYADDARLIRAFVTAPTSVVGSHSKLPSSVIILINGRLFSRGSRVCTSILTLRFWHHTNYHSILVMYPPHAVTSLSLTNLGPVARLVVKTVPAAKFCWCAPENTNTALIIKVRLRLGVGAI